MSCGKILVVEDDRSTAGKIEPQLSELGYLVLSITDTGPEAFDKIRRFSPDLMLLDINPGVARENIDTARTIMREFHVPVIFLAGQTDRDTLVRALDTQPLPEKNKPLGVQDLHTTISLALTGKQAGPDNPAARPDRARYLWQVKFTCNTDGKITRIHHGSKKTLQNIGIDNYLELFPDTHEQQIKAGIAGKKPRLVFRKRNEDIICCEYSPLTDNVVNVSVSGLQVPDGQTTRDNIDQVFLLDILDRLNAATILFNDELNIIYSNKSAQSLLNNGACLGNYGGFLTCHNPEITAALKEMARGQKDHLMSIDRGEDQKALNVMVTPLKTGLLTPVENKPTTILFAFEITDDYARIEEVIRSLYHLSPMEAKLVAQLFITPHLATAATTLGITLNTARTHLKRIYSKTRVNRISSLIHLIVTGPASVILNINP